MFIQKAPFSGPITPGPRDLTSFLASVGTCIMVALIHIDTHTFKKLITPFKNQK